jgi:anti-sigma-K factor RskA
VNETRTTRIPDQRHPHFSAFRDRVLAHPETRAAYQAAERRADRRAALRRWRLVLIGLAVWTVLVLLWATTPSGCGAPGPDGRVHCSHSGLLH